jgi:hypothetical protein
MFSILPAVSSSVIRRFKRLERAAPMLVRGFSAPELTPTRFGTPDKRSELMVMERSGSLPSSRG